MVERIHESGLFSYLMHLSLRNGRIWISNMPNKNYLNVIADSKNQTDQNSKEYLTANTIKGYKDISNQTASKLSGGISSGGGGGGIGWPPPQ